MSYTKTWIIGLGRTGTRSICEALKILGYKNVKHNVLTFADIDGTDAGAESLFLQNYKYLDIKYPASKFILTTRPIKEWLQSVAMAMKIYQKEKMPNEFYDAMLRNRMIRFGCIDYDELKLRKKYYEHHFDVYNYFDNRPDLLTLETSDFSWEPLCQFLNLPIPNQQFPCIKDG